MLTELQLFSLKHTVLPQRNKGKAEGKKKNSQFENAGPEKKTNEGQELKLSQGAHSKLRKRLGGG